MCGETLSLTELSSARVRKVNDGDMLWNFLQECRVEVCSELQSLTVLSAVLERKASNANRL